MTASEAVRQAFAATQRERWEEADRLCRAVLEAEPDRFDALYLLGYVAIRTGRMREASELLARAIAIDARNAELHNNLGIALGALGRNDEAVASFRRAIALTPAFADAHTNLGNTLRDLGRDDDALASYEHALALAPDAATHFNRGNLLAGRGRAAEAVAAYDEALRLHPQYAEAHNNRGNALRRLDRHAESIDGYARAIALRADYAEAHNNCGNALRELQQPVRAVESYERAIRIRPDFADAHNNLGNALHDLGRDAEALASYDRALAIRPDAGTFVNRGNLLREAKRFREALVDYERALELEPWREFLYGLWLHVRMRICDWADSERHVAELTARVARCERASLPFSMLSISDSPAVLRQAAEAWVASRFPPGHELPPIARRPPRGRIRLGYFSADFHEHATMHVMAELFELHDKSRFELTAFSFGPDTGDATRARVAAAFDRFLDVRAQSDAEIALLARELEIDIAIDMKGFTQGSRPGIFARRAAPVQVNYLGYPGTMGAQFIDYLIADEFVIPENERQHYAEKVAYLPHTYWATDRKREIASSGLSRDEAGLPSEAFVFCCFNSAYKIRPGTFDCWMDILRQVGGSVLWLLHDNDDAVANLRAEAGRRGVDPARVVFAPHLPSARHLARHRLADLFLDTLPYNAHTTAVDALWTGLPVVTCTGNSFVGRVAASVLHAIGMPELVTSTMDAYRSLAIELATDRERLDSAKRKLADNRLATPLFDSARETRCFEAAYRAMVERWQAGEPPDEIHVEDE